METLLFVYEFQDSEKIVRYNCLTDYKASSESESSLILIEDDAGRSWGEIHIFIIKIRKVD